uniref:AIG1-type G domain-containing protein n=1 Tax=Biomphalaria glabrata TaxID=6526 RepID=A0A2C9LSP6_BIOGL
MFDTCAISEENKPHLKSVNGNGFSVIECSCIKDEEDDSEHDFEVAGEAIRNFENRTDVILFVMKYGVRYTQQEKHAVERLRTIFGETVFRDWVVICFSYGDNFEKDKQENGNDFETWCWAQSGAVQTLFKEVEYRIVLFNNKAELLESTEQELNKFIRIIVHRNHDQHKELKVQNLEKTTQEDTTVIIKKNSLLRRLNTLIKKKGKKYEKKTSKNKKSTENKSKEKKSATKSSGNIGKSN